MVMVGVLTGMLGLAGCGSTLTATAKCGVPERDLRVSTQGTSGEAYIGVQLRRGESGECTLMHDLKVIALQNGWRARIRGNPAHFAPRLRLRADEHGLVIVVWASWCGMRRGMSLVVQYGSAKWSGELNFLPECRGSSREGGLRVVQSAAVSS